MEPSNSLNPLSREERAIIELKGTEPPFTGEYDDLFEEWRIVGMMNYRD